MSLSADPSTSTLSDHWLVESLLREQRELPAVERFSHWHAELPPQHARYYRDLIPLAQPGPGQQYAFEVDLDTCSGCQACVTACHSLNGLDEEEIWRSVGLLHGKVNGEHLLRHVTTACHHCLEPACLQGCPTLAYEKDPVTGTVRHLDDQCFGCQYCILMCPYEVPKYSTAKGIVRKCDMCRQRLAADEAPACVQACPNQAIKIRLVAKAEVSARCEANDFLPQSPDARLTSPTTRFVTRAPLSAAVIAADEEVHRPAHAHWPLIWMLVLTQMSLGILAGGHVMTSWLGWLPADPSRVIVNGAAAAIGALGASLATLHLGRPQIAWRAWLGWRTSWLSREVIAFGAYVPLLLLAAAASLIGSLRSFAPLLEFAAVIAGVGAVVCSGMIYAATKRPLWSARRTLTRFGFTVLLLGNATCTFIAAALVSQSDSVLSDYRVVLASMAVAAAVVAWRVTTEAQAFHHLLAEVDPTLRGTGQLLVDRPLRYIVRRKRSWSVAAAFGLPLLAMATLSNLPDTQLLRGTITGICFCQLAFALAAELADRYLFFAACVSPRMPGGIAS